MLSSYFPPNVHAMPTPTAPTGRPTIRLKGDTFREACVARGLVTDVSRAVALGVSRAQVIRAQNGATTGEAFIAAVLARFGAHRFADFFRVAA